MKHLYFLILFLTVSAAAQRDPEPVKVYSKDGISIRSYDFARFKPFLEKETDTTYVINFWATWCAPCIKEIPHFESVGKKYKGDKVRVLLVSLDMAKQVESALIPFVKRKKLQQDVVHLHDPNADAWISKVHAEWSGALPATLIYNSSKRQFYEREFTQEELEAEINKFK